MSTCYYCDLPAIERKVNPKHCLMHWRFKGMRELALRRGLQAPTYAELEDMVPPGMICPFCKRAMNWLSKEGGRSVVITLQHDRGGSVRLMCHGCNARHYAYEGDSFYQLDQTKKMCPRCKVEKPPSEFYTHGKQRKWMNRTSYCKPCHLEKGRAYRDARREAYRLYYLIYDLAKADRNE